MSQTPKPPISVPELIAKVNHEQVVKYVTVLASKGDVVPVEDVNLLCQTQLGKSADECFGIMFMFASEQDRQKFRDEF